MSSATNCLLLVLVVLTTALVLAVQATCPDTMPHGCTCDDDPTIYVECINSSLTEIPQDLPDHVVYLKMQGNNISTISNITYKKLKKLYLIDNRIRVIKDNAFALLSELQLLSLEKNHLFEVRSKTLNGLGNLQLLYLEDNGIKSLDHNAFNGQILRNIVDIRLSRNELTIFDSAPFSHLDRLKELSLVNNKITHLGTFSAADAMPNLQVLTLSDNKITELKDDQFSGLIKLKKFVASHNEIQLLPLDAFSGLERTLEEVFLDWNRLGPTIGDVFRDMRRLEMLQLSHNKLSWLDEDSLNWDDLEHLLVEDNAWDCHCRNSWMLKKDAVKDHNPNLRCSTPEDLYDMPVATLSRRTLDCHHGRKNQTAVGFVVGLFIAFFISFILFIIYYCRSKSKRGGDGISRYKRMGGDKGEQLTF